MVHEDQDHLGVEDENHYHQSTQLPMLVALVAQWKSVLEMTNTTRVNQCQQNFIITFGYKQKLMCEPYSARSL